MSATQHPVSQMTRPGRRLRTMPSSPQFKHSLVLIALLSAVLLPSAGAATSTRSVARIVSVGTNENGRIAFVSSWAENLAAEVYRADVRSGRRTNLSRNPTDDEGAVVSPDGRTILFQSFRDNTSSIWAMNADGSDQRMLAAGSGPTWSPDGRRIAFIVGEDVMTMAADGTDVRRVARGQWAAWSPQGDTLAWLDRSSLFLGASDGSNARVLYSTTFVYSVPSWAPDGKRIALAAEVLLTSGSIFHGIVAVPVAGGEVQRLASVRLSDSPGEIMPTWSPDGKQIAYVDGRGISAVRVADGTTVGLTHPPANRADRLPVWSPDGRFLAFARGLVPQQLFVVSASGGRPRQITHEDAQSWLASPDRISWTPDGRALVYSNRITNNDTDIYTVNPDGSGRHRLTANNVNDLDPAWSPDGRWIAFVRTLPVGRAGDSNAELFLMRSDGSGVRRLTHWPGEDFAPAWSPDGSQIVFVRRTARRVDPLLSLYTIRMDGSHLTRMQTPDEFYDSPSWSPNGRAIALTRGGGEEVGVDSGGAVIVVRADGSGARVIDDPGDDADAYPQWSPDGRAISFVRETWVCDYCDDETDLWTVSPDASGAKSLVAGPEDAAWSPDGAYLVVLRGDLGIVTREGSKVRELEAARGVANPGLSWQPACALSGTSRADRLQARVGGQRVCGLGGDDAIRGGAARDQLFGETGDDWIDARGGGFDVVGCGLGVDRVLADRRDLVGLDCERVTRR